ncbi:MAG: hypothetical protein DHS80DRAFT_23438 [Piptocephalis tieghemiana]|nr:MAG: hypothetical protein DHS80DRAFT_23438 [Piptocephalis tieghemiana]
MPYSLLRHESPQPRGKLSSPPPSLPATSNPIFYLQALSGYKLDQHCKSKSRVEPSLRRYVLLLNTLRHSLDPIVPELDEDTEMVMVDEEAYALPMRDHQPHDHTPPTPPPWSNEYGYPHEESQDQEIPHHVRMEEEEDAYIQQGEAWLDACLDGLTDSEEGDGLMVIEAEEEDGVVPQRPPFSYIPPDHSSSSSSSPPSPPPSPPHSPCLSTLVPQTRERLAMDLPGRCAWREMVFW